MMHKNKENVSAVIFFNLITLLGEFCLLNLTKLNNEAWVNVAALSVIFNITLQVSYLMRKKIAFSVGGIFILVTYLFQCSYIIMISTGIMKPSDYFYTLQIPRHGFDTFKNGTNVAIIFVGMCFIGYILGRDTYDKKKMSQITTVNPLSVKCLGWLMIVIFGSIYFYYTYNQVSMVGMKASYLTLSEFRTSEYSTARSLQIFYFIGLYLLAFYYNSKNLKQAVRIIFIISLISACFLLLTGARSQAAVFIVLIFFMWQQFDVKISFKRFVLYCFYGILILNLFYAIRVTRQYSFTIENLFEAFLSSNDILYETMSEFGFSVFVTGLLDQV